MVSKKIKLLTIIGARPQFIKAAAISRAIKNNFDNQIEEILVHTGQHYDSNMSKVFFEELKIPKEKYNLNVGSGSHSVQTAKMMTEMDTVINKENPTAILLYGDTNSTLAACLVAIKEHIPIIHVEAGVRSYNKKFPEEVNRLVCDHMSSLLFVPSDAGINSLSKEGVNNTNNNNNVSPDNPRVYRCGDIMYDNTLFYRDNALNSTNNIFKKYNLPNENIILATLHRPSNVDQKESLENILKAFHKIIEQSNRSIILPLHPRTLKSINQIHNLTSYLNHEKLHVIPPVSFLDMVVIEEHVDLIITDSGGIQKEAYFMNKPCLIMLEETPWTELIETKTAKLVGSSYDKLINGASEFLNKEVELNYPELYGDGKASQFICSKIIEAFQN